MARPVLRRLNDIKLRDKILLSFLLLMVVPELVLGVLVVGEFRQSTLRQALGQAEAGVERLDRETQNLLAVAVRLGDRIAGSRDVEALLTTRYPSTLEVFRAYHDFDMFRLYRDVTPEVTAIRAYVDNPTLLDNWEIRPLTEEVRRSFWYQEARNHPNTTGWFSWDDETRPGVVRLSLVRSLPYPTADDPTLLVIDVDPGMLNNLLGQAGLETMVLDPRGLVVAASRADRVGRPLDDAALTDRLAHPPTGTFVRTLKPASSFNGLTVAALASPAVILQSADRVAVLGFALLAGGSLLALGFLWFVYRVLAGRLERMTVLLPQVGAGDFSAQLPVDGQDEIGQLAIQFNAMVRAVRLLMDEVTAGHETARRLERAQDAIKLKMLASQINPHFLFNVLEAIRMKAHLRGETEIAQIVKLLGRLMRRNLEARGEPIPLAEELENVRCFLAIEKFRLEEKLRYRIDADPEALTVPVLPLVIEPLVENAVVHGLGPRVEGGTVTITVRLDDRLVVEVADDGVGLAPDRLASLLTASTDRHVGLANIHQRLELTYGPEAGLRVESEPGRGTRVRFAIPLAGEGA